MSEPSASGRDPASGRLLPGHRVSVGNKGSNGTVRRMRELRAAALESATPDQVGEAMEKLRTLGMAGDVQALRLWLEFVVGKPHQAIEVTTPDGPALDIRAIAAVVIDAIGDDQGARFRVAAALAALGRRGDVDGDGMGE